MWSNYFRSKSDNIKPFLLNVFCDSQGSNLFEKIIRQKKLPTSFSLTNGFVIRKNEKTFLINDYEELDKKLLIYLVIGHL